MATALRRAKWHPPPPPTPRVLHLPRRPRRRQLVKSVAGVDQGIRRQEQQPPQGNLEALFGQERAFCYPVPPVVLLNSGERGRRERSPEVEEEERGNEGMDGIWEEKWRFQGEILRAECKFLRMERQIAVKRLERERVFMNTTLKSTLHSLISARRKVGEGGSVSLVLEEEIKELAKKLAELQRSSKKTTRRDPELLKGGARTSTNFDKQATLLHKQLEEIGGLSNEECVVDVREVVKASLTQQATENGLAMEENASNQGSSRFDDVEILRRKMEGLSEGRLLKKMEDEDGPMLSRTTNTSAANSASNSLRYDFLDLSSLQESLQEKKLCEQKICAGHCKVIVRRIMEQVRAETEQWSQMQEMLGQVRAEMEQLQVSRDFWEGRALDSDNKIQSLNATVQEWKQKALSLEINEQQQENVVYSLQEQLERLRIEKGPKEVTIKDLTPHPQEKEKRVLTCRVKGKIQAEESCRKIRDVLHDRRTVSHRGCSRVATPNRQPFQDIGNLSPLARQNGKRWVLPLQSL